MKDVNAVRARIRTIGIVVGLVLLVAATDQAIKYWIVQGLALGESRTLLPGFISLTHNVNHGAAFSLLNHAPATLLLLLSCLVLAVFLVIIKPFLGTRGGLSAAVLVFGGALGNLIDRVRLQHVVDYIDLHIGHVFQWAVFNLADACVVIGVGILMIVMLRQGREAPTAPEGERE